MGKIKIHEIAKKMGLTSKEVLEKAKSLNFDVKSHLSAVTDEEAKKLEEELNNSQIGGVFKKEDIGELYEKYEIGDKEKRQNL